jgi:hypothetical protein
MEKSLAVKISITKNYPLHTDAYLFRDAILKQSGLKVIST